MATVKLDMSAWDNDSPSNEEQEKEAPSTIDKLFGSPYKLSEHPFKALDQSLGSFIPKVIKGLTYDIPKTAVEPAWNYLSGKKSGKEALYDFGHGVRELGVGAAQPFVHPIDSFNRDPVGTAAAFIAPEESLRKGGPVNSLVRGEATLPEAGTRIAAGAQKIGEGGIDFAKQSAAKMKEATRDFIQFTPKDQEQLVGRIQRDALKIDKPPIKKVQTPQLRQQYFSREALAQDEILQQSLKDGIKPEEYAKNATVETDFQATTKALDNVFAEYDSMMRKADGRGLTVPADKLIGFWSGLLKNRAMIEEGMAPFITERIKQIQENGDYTLTESQERLKATNEKINPDTLVGKEYHQHNLRVLENQLMRKIMEDQINSITGESYQALRNRYGALAQHRDTMARGVNNALTKEARSSGTWLDAIAGIEAVAGLLTWNPAAIKSALATEGIAYVRRTINNPDKALRRMYDAHKKVFKPRDFYDPEAGKPNFQMQDYPTDLHYGEASGPTIDAEFPVTALLENGQKKLPLNREGVMRPYVGEPVPEQPPAAPAGLLTGGTVNAGPTGLITDTAGKEPIRAPYNPVHAPGSNAARAGRNPQAVPHHSAPGPEFEHIVKKLRELNYSDEEIQFMYSKALEKFQRQ